jgi:hypothetical protein
MKNPSLANISALEAGKRPRKPWVLNDDRPRVLPQCRRQLRSARYPHRYRRRGFRRRGVDVVALQHTNCRYETGFRRADGRPRKSASRSRQYAEQ